MNILITSFGFKTIDYIIDKYVELNPLKLPLKLLLKITNKLLPVDVIEGTGEKPQTIIRSGALLESPSYTRT